MHCWAIDGFLLDNKAVCTQFKVGGSCENALAPAAQICSLPAGPLGQRSMLQCIARGTGPLYVVRFRIRTLGLSPRSSQVLGFPRRFRSLPRLTRLPTPV